MTRFHLKRIVMGLSLVLGTAACDRVYYFQDNQITIGSLEFQIEAFDFRDRFFTQVRVQNTADKAQSIDSTLSVSQETLRCFEGKIDVQKLPRTGGSPVTGTLALPAGETRFFNCVGSSPASVEKVLKGPFGTIALALKPKRP